MTTLEMIKTNINNTIKIEREIFSSMQNHDFGKAVYLDNQQKQIRENIKMIANDNGLDSTFADILKRSLEK